MLYIYRVAKNIALISSLFSIVLLIKTLRPLFLIQLFFTQRQSLFYIVDFNGWPTRRAAPARSLSQIRSRGIKQSWQKPVHFLLILCVCRSVRHVRIIQETTTLKVQGVVSTALQKFSHSQDQNSLYIAFIKKIKEYSVEHGPIIGGSTQSL